MRLSLSTISFLNVSITALIFTMVLAYFVVFARIDDFHDHQAQLERTYVERQLQRVTDEVERAAQRIAILHRQRIRTHAEAMRRHLDTALQNGVIDPHRLAHGEPGGYYFTFSPDGTLLHHPLHPEWVGDDLFAHLHDVASTALIRTAVQEGTAYRPFDVPLPHTLRDNTCVYVRRSGDVFVAAVLHAARIEANFQHDMLDVLRHERFGAENFGYFWVADTQFRMRMHPIAAELEQTDLRTFRTLDGQYLFRDVKAAIEHNATRSLYLKYRWHKPRDTAPIWKHAYVKALEYDGWILGSGFYYDDLQRLLTREQQGLEASMRKDVRDALVILSLLFGMTLLIAAYVARRIRVTESRQRHYLHQLEQYKRILDESAVVSKTDATGIIDYVNETFCRVSGYAFDEAVGKSHAIVRSLDTPKELISELWRSIEAGSIWRGVLKNRRKDGRPYYNSTTIIPLFDENGAIEGYISAGTDVTELFENKDKLRRFILTDRLTSLGSRFRLLELLSNHTDARLGLIDVDRFKEVNDLLGQENGDLLLKAVADTLYRGTDPTVTTLFRIHADVFALYSDRVALAPFMQMLFTLQETMSQQPFEIGGNRLHVTVTLGIADGRDNLLAAADIALWRAKRNKRNYELFDAAAEPANEYRDTLQWVERLRAALDEGRIVPYYQPIYSYKTGRIEKYECLMRLIDDHGVHLPEAFLGIAKKTKLYPKLTLQMIEKIFTDLAESDAEFSINLGAEDLLSDETMNFLITKAKKQRCASRIVLEIVETEELERFEVIARALQRCKAIGMKIAIDDFGTGYSNFDYLISMQADYIKIDGSIIQKIRSDLHARELVASIVGFVHKAGMQTIAEYVFDAETDAAVRGFGVDFAQGYYYSPPLPVQALRH